MTSARVAVAARPASVDRRPTRTSSACRASLPPRRNRPAQRRPAGRGLSVVRRRRQGVPGTCLLQGIRGFPPAVALVVGGSPAAPRRGGNAAYTIAQLSDV